MNQTIDIVERLGTFGLRERVGEEDLKEGLNNLNLIVELKDSSPERNPYIGDDFIPRTNVYNALGAIYPSLSREQKLDGLRSILGKMDGIRYDRVSMNHTPYIRDPQLLSDIGASRVLYWPGLHDEEKIWKGKSFEEVKRDILSEDGLFLPDKVNNDFLVAYGLLRSDFTSFGEVYSEAAHPEFLKRVLKGIVTLRFGRCENDTEVEKGRKRLQELLPRRLHEQIESIRNEADWTIITEVVH